MSRELAIARAGRAVGRVAETIGSGSSAQGSLSASVRSPVMWGYAIILVFVVGFGLWAALAPLAGGAIASGIISPNSSRRVVQHLEGGIIRDLKVRDGAEVKAGDPLMVLEPIQPQSAHDVLLADLRALEARKVRLEAERSGAADVTFPPSLLENGAPVAVAASQKNIFEARAQARAAQVRVQRQRIAQLEAEIDGHEAQIRNIVQQMGLINEEVEGKEKLLAQGLIPKPEALRLRRAQSELGCAAVGVRGGQRQGAAADCGNGAVDCKRRRGTSRRGGRRTRQGRD